MHRRKIGNPESKIKFGGGGGNRTRIQRLRPRESTRLVVSL
jgi:hypothetical protein